MVRPTVDELIHWLSDRPAYWPSTWNPAIACSDRLLRGVIDPLTARGAYIAGRLTPKTDIFPSGLIRGLKRARLFSPKSLLAVGIIALTEVGIISAWPSIGFSSCRALSWNQCPTLAKHHQDLCSFYYLSWGRRFGFGGAAESPL